MEFNKPSKEDPRRKLRKTWINQPGDFPNATTTKVRKSIKSFSHELGLKGGVQSPNPRAHSFNDLKVLLIFIARLLGFGGCINFNVK